MKFTALILGVLFCFSAFASENSPSPIYVPDSLRQKLKSFEPSCAVYIPALDRYLIGSDDTTMDSAPLLFLMSPNGQVDENPIRINGVEKMTDVESLSRADDGSIYIMSSLSLNKNGKNKTERNLFLKAKPQSHGLKVGDGVELRPLLLEGLMASEDPVLKKMRGKYESLLEIESHFIKDGQLYVGLKDPQVTPNHAVILKLGRLDDVFAGKVDVRLWHVVNLDAGDGVINRLSDTVWKGDKLLVLSTSSEGVGHLWLAGEHMKRLEDFHNVHPEGLAFDNKGQALVLFDQGIDGDGLFQYVTSSKNSKRRSQH